ncbi:hypothetical protein ACR3K2_32920 [Cryptosporidium serpentis]
MVLPNLNTPLYIIDPEIRELIKEEIERQVNGLPLVAAESLVSSNILYCLGSIFAQSTYELEYIKGSKFEKLYNSKDKSIIKFNKYKDKDNKIKDILEDNTSIKLYENFQISIDNYNLNTGFNFLTYENLNKVNLQNINKTLIDPEILTLSKNSPYISPISTLKNSINIKNTYFSSCLSITKLQDLTEKRALKIFNLDLNIWGVNIHPISGTPANFALLSYLLKPHDRIMGLSLQSGGHLTHGHYTNERRVSCSSYFFESLPYIAKNDGYIDYEELEKNAILFSPKLIFVGSSSYPRIIDFKKFKSICNKVNAILVADIAHYAGLIAANLYPSPFEYADIVTTTTHMTLCGPRSGMIFFNKLKYPCLVNSYREIVTPSIQDSVRFNHIAALCTQLNKINCTNEWKEQMLSTIYNAKSLAYFLQSEGAKIITNGTDSHIILIDTSIYGISGYKTEKLFEACGIFLSRSSLPSDGRNMSCSGVRIGTTALTIRGLKHQDFKNISFFIIQAIKIAQKIDKEGNKSILGFIEALPKYSNLINPLKNMIAQYMTIFQFSIGEYIS